jgi:hypothetical protein
MLSVKYKPPMLCHYAECRCAECRGAHTITQKQIIHKMRFFSCFTILGPVQ